MIILTWITCCQKLYSYKVAKQNDDCFPGLSRQYICQVDILQQLFKSVTETVPLFYFSVVLATIFSTALRHSNCLLVVFGVLQTIFPNQVDFQQQKSAPTKEVSQMPIFPFLSNCHLPKNLGTNCLLLLSVFKKGTKSLG